MRHRSKLLVIGLMAVLVVGGTGLAAAHSWQTEVEQDDKVLGINSAPEDPVAGMETEFSGSITDNAAEEGQESRTDYGGVTNKSLEVHINGPGHVHDHVTAEVPEDDSHFGFSYVFPEPGNYTMTVVAMIDGEEYAFEFTREVGMIPTRAEGEVVENITQNTESIDQQVQDLHTEIDDLNDKIDEIKNQNQQLSSQHDEAGDASSDDEEEQTSSGLGAGFGVAVAVAALLGAGALFMRKRS
jgi:PGF-CTERM protein